MNKLGSIIHVLIGGGLIVLLFFLSLEKSSVLSWDGAEYSLSTRYSLNAERSDLGTHMPHQDIIMDEDWEVVETLDGDFNNDGIQDVAIYLWKHGNYGPDSPFWVDENDDSYKMHLFLYTWKDGEMRSLWHSSNLPTINVKTILIDINNDGENELVILERPYEWGPGSSGETVAVWKWDEWGFSNEWRSEKGVYEDLVVATI